MQLLSGQTDSKAVVSSQDQWRQQQMEKAATEFEAIFISMMMKELRQTQSGEGLFPGDKSDTFGGMFDMLMGEQMAASGGIGLSSFLKSAGGHFSAPDEQPMGTASGNSTDMAFAAYRSAAVGG